MKLTRYTDFALRVLMHLAAAPEPRASIAEVAAAYGISENHPMKVVQDLGRQGFITTVRGRGGGIRLARPAETITVGEVVRATEDDCPMVDCSTCVIAGSCRLTGALAEARAAFFRVLDGYSIAEVARRPELALPMALAHPAAQSRRGETARG